MTKTPLTILNGFLGAGKTTLLRNLLVQAHKQQLTVCVVVNDMSELDVDGVLISNTEIVNESKNNFVTISADSISSCSGIEKLDAALKKMLAQHHPDLILLETSGSSHPLPLVRYLRDHAQVQLKGFLSLVDSVMLNDDFDVGQTLIPRLQANLEKGERRIENLLAEQIMFCSQLLLTRADRLPTENVVGIAQAIHPLNPYVAVSALSWGNLRLNDILTMPDYDFHRVAALIEELAPEVDAPKPQEAGAWTMTSEVIYDDRPFHPQRLWDACHHFMGAGIYRSKGFFWLPGRDDLALLWNQASGSINLEFISYWKAGILRHTDNHLTIQERQILQEEVENAPGRFGDRRCSLTVIGEKTQVSAFVAALRDCFLTGQEIAWWREGGTFPDPWPQRVSRISSQES
ncbi:TPA: GTP-binding protein [Klebsiella variicola]|uniref:CobW family GTP-binding protein n=1 Tax=Klebsiella variicola TaxID=244366 RepID=UPI0007D6F6FD|nr:GTP-binding protein [Klebsiella variicola]PXJ81702.1 cobalamin biosynthesis protein CobW [Klebsiella variicola]HCL6959821.1 GTP-binding protein [Klebsiella variicola]